MVQHPPVCQGFLMIEASWSHSDTPQSVGHLWASDQPDTETSKWQHTTITRDRNPLRHAGFELAIPTSERPQTDSLDRTTAEIGTLKFMFIISMNEKYL